MGVSRIGLLPLIVLALVGCGGGERIIETREVAPFDRLQISESVDVKVVEGDGRHVRVYAGEKVIDRVVTRSSGGVLEIDIKDRGIIIGDDPLGDVRVRVAASDLDAERIEISADVDLGFMRWLTVNVPGEPERELVLTKPGPPQHDDATAEQIRELVTKGAMGMAAIIAVDDVHKTYEELVAKGVEFTEEPTERFYGTDCGLRDPFGNHLRIGTPKQGPIGLPDPAEFAAQNTP